MQCLLANVALTDLVAREFEIAYLSQVTAGQIQPAARCQGSKTRHEKVQSREGYHVDCQLPEIGIELTREPEAGGDAGHGEGYQMVQVSIGRGGKFQGTETNIIKCLVVNAERLVSVFYQLVDRQGGVVGFDHCITDLV